MKLYKFSNVDINKLTCIQTNQIWFASQATCNDPFEGRHSFTELQSESEIRESDDLMFDTLARIGIDNADKKFSTEKAQNATKIGISEYSKRSILSMSASSHKNKPQFNNLMWSHYADAMKGYCLQFDLNKFISSIYNVATVDDAIIYGLCDFVGYSEFVPQVFPMDPTSSRNLIFTKSEHWEYENEFRLTSQRVGKHIYDPKSLEQVILGFNMPIEQQILMYNIVKAVNSNVVFKEAILKKGSYLIEFIDFDIDKKVDSILVHSG